jgi:branched-chain amino acid transport system ATP-binding protein
MLTVTDLSVRYGQIEALHGLGLSVAKGSVTVLLGSNGAGKSSTLNAIIGLAQPQGRIEFEGSRIDGLAPEDVVRKGIALCPEGRRVFPSLSVAENLHLGGAVHAKGEALAARVEAELTRFPILRDRFHQKAGLLSGGEQQMLAIARVLSGAPKLLLIDEPTEGLAPMIVEDLFRLMRELTQDGIAIVLVEQNVHLALELTDRFYLVERGQITLAGDARESTARAELIERISV